MIYCNPITTTDINCRVSPHQTLYGRLGPYKLKFESCVTLKLADEGLIGVVVKVSTAIILASLQA